MEVLPLHAVLLRNPKSDVVRQAASQPLDHARRDIILKELESLRMKAAAVAWYDERVAREGCKVGERPLLHNVVGARSLLHSVREAEGSP